MKQKLIRLLINFFGNTYISLERHLEYPHDHNILKINIDEELQDMSRLDLCQYMDNHLPEKGFFELDSTTKIRLGCQLLKDFNKHAEQN